MSRYTPQCPRAVSLKPGPLFVLLSLPGPLGGDARHRSQISTRPTSAPMPLPQGSDPHSTPQSQ